MVAEDLELATRASRGDEEAFESIYRANYLKVYHHAARIMGDLSEAEDLAQEVFLRAYQFIGSYSGAASLSRWLKKITTNLCIDRIRKKTVATVPWPTSVSKDGEELEADFPDGGLSPLDEVMAREGEDRILAAIAGLPEYYRKVVMFHDLLDHRDDEVAGVVSCPVGTVKSRLSRAHGILRLSLAGSEQRIAARGA